MKTMQFSRGGRIGLREPAGQNCTVLGGSQVGHDCAVLGLSGVLGNRWTINEGCAIFRRSGEKASRWDCMEKLHNLP